MLTEPARSQYCNLRFLAVSLADQGVALSVLAGTRPGVVFVDDVQSPSVLFIGAPEGTFAWAYLAGRPDHSAFNAALRQWLFAERGLGEDIAFLFLAPSTCEWSEGLDEILAPRVPIPDRRLHYECTEAPSEWRGRVPPGYEIRPLDRSLMQSDVTLHPSVEQWMMHNYGSQDAFLDHGAGSVAVHDSSVVAWCIADSVVADLSDIGVETVEAHRRRGLAYCATCLTVEQLLARGIQTIGWHCGAWNEPSIRTAEQAGFRRIREAVLYPVQYDEGRHAKMAEVIGAEFAEAIAAAWTAGRIEEVESLYTRVCGFADVEGETHVLAARAAAALGCDDTAFARLQRAADSGWSHPMPQQALSEMKGLESDPRWRRVVRSMGCGPSERATQTPPPTA